MKLMIGLVAVVLCASGWLTQAQTNSGKRNIAKENPAPATGAKYLQEIYTVKVEPVKAEPVKVGPANEIESCAYLLPEKENKKLTMMEIAVLIGDPVPFSVEAHGADQLIIYSSLEKVDKTTLSVLEKHINELAQFRTFEVELKIPHARAVGDLVTKVEALHSAGLTVEAVGEDRIRVSSESAPECSEWQQFLTNLREMAWRPESSSPVDRVFYLNSSDLAGALNSGGGGKGGGGEKSDNPSVTVNAIGSQGADKSDASSGSAGGGTGSATGSKPSSGKSTSKGKSAQTTASSSGGANKPTGGDTDDSTDQTSSSAADTSTKQQGSESTTAAATATPDLLVFSEANPGDDRAVNEKRRIVAALDLPRPEMIVNAMSFQISSKDYKTVRRANKEVREQVSYFNDRLQAAVISGWKVVKEQSERPGGNFYNHAFYDYIARRYIGDSPAVKTLTTDQAKTPITNQEAAQAFLEYRDKGKLAWSNSERDKWGICQATKYCLGYSTLFDPVKPQLTNLLMVLIAMQKPLDAVEVAVDEMENRKTTLSTDQKIRVCELVDREAYEDLEGPFFECFRKAAEIYFEATQLPLLRSSVADFLFHYKMSNEFPHEFSPYDLDLSANALNMALSPLIDAFNEDLIVYQRNLADKLLPLDKLDKNDKRETEQMATNESDKRQKDRKAFRNYGLISVHTVAGKETVVDTATQSYLDASSAPSLAQMMSSIAQAKSSVPGIMATNLSANAATTIAGALNAMQPTEAKVGRGFKIDLMPRSLPGASTAELDVTMTVEETAEPTIYSGGTAVSSGDSFSRVAKHDTTTKMRVDSLRIFEVSSLYAQLERSRARFPLLPIPGLEIPYIGCLIGIPLRPATEYHTSVAVLGAIVVPTANDLAYGTRFEGDRIVTGTCSAGALDQCVFRRPASIADLGKNIRLFHQQMVHCLAGGTVSMAPEASGGATGACAALDISKLPSDSNW